MKFLIDKQILSESLKKFQGILEKNPVVPIASSLLFEAKENEIIISATNFEVGIIVRKILPVLEKGTIVVDGQKFSEIVNQMPEGEIGIEKKMMDGLPYGMGKPYISISPSCPMKKYPPLRLMKRCVTVKLKRSCCRIS